MSKTDPKLKKLGFKTKVIEFKENFLGKKLLQTTKNPQLKRV